MYSLAHFFQIFLSIPFSLTLLPHEGDIFTSSKHKDRIGHPYDFLVYGRLMAGGNSMTESLRIHSAPESEP